MNFLKRSLRRWYWTIPRDATGKMRWGLYLRRILLGLAGLFFIVSFSLVILYAILPVPITPLMVIRCVQQSNDPKREVRLEKDWVSYSELPNNLQLAVVCAEDQFYPRHDGFDFESIEKAVEHNKTHKRKRGASTISQQTAKNTFLWPARSWVRKGLEVYFTFLIEMVWSKHRIMTVYLNVIEFGDGIYGAEAAARHYYKKSAKDLTREQAAMLAAVLPNPLKYKVKNPSRYILRRQQWILDQMRMWKNRLDLDNPNTPGIPKNK